MIIGGMLRRRILKSMINWSRIKKDAVRRREIF